MNKTTAQEYVARIVEAAIPKRHPDFAKLQENLALAVSQIWDAAAETERWKEFVLGFPASASFQRFNFPPGLDFDRVEVPVEGVYNARLALDGDLGRRFIEITTNGSWPGTVEYVRVRTPKKA